VARFWRPLVSGPGETSDGRRIKMCHVTLCSWDSQLFKSFCFPECYPVLHKNYFSTAFGCVLIHFATDTDISPLTTKEHLIVNLRVHEKVRTNAHETRHNGEWSSIHHEQCQNTLKRGIIPSLLSQNEPTVTCP